MVARCGHFLATALLALSCSAQPLPALAATEPPTVELPAASASSSTGGALDTVYFGNGCFWGRQKDFVDVEIKQLGKKPQEVSAVVGYAGGRRAGPGNRVCYYYADPLTQYESLGHAEVVALGVTGQADFEAFAKRYFAQFVRTPYGMMRSDPQDRGPGYRNVVGLPGGVRSSYFPLLQAANTNGMELREGRGNETGNFFLSTPEEDDMLNVVWVVDSEALPFYRAESYHQFHDGLGKKFSKEYTQELRAQVASQGRIAPTGCPEISF